MDTRQNFRSALADRYVIEREIGRGGMATVYLALDVRHRRKVALKIINPELVFSTGRDRFQREIDIIANLRHPHIVPLYDSGLIDTGCYFVMPYLDGESLRSLLNREGRLPIDQALAIAGDIAEALDHAHSYGVIHRDVTPGNIMLESGHATLTDFGIARAIEIVTAERLTDSGYVPGTPLYMSPEQAGGSASIDGRADIYSLGCVLFEMIAGEAPFTGRSRKVILAQKAAMPPPLLGDIRSDVSRHLDRVVERALATDPAKRFNTAAQFRAALIQAAPVAVGQIPSPSPAFAATPVGSQRSSATRARVNDPTLAKFLRWAFITAGAFMFVWAVGHVTTAAFDAKLQVPAQYRPTGSPIASGLRAIIPVAVFGAAASLMRLLVRSATRLAGRSFFPALSRAIRTMQWHRSGWWRRTSTQQPDLVAEIFLLAVVVSISGFLALSWPYVASPFNEEIDALSCNFRPAARTWAAALSIVFVALAAAWLKFFSVLGKQNGIARGIWFPRYASAGAILLFLIALTAPWKLMWNASYERVLVDGERAYVLVETPTEVVIYNAARRQTRTRLRGDTLGLVRSGVDAHVFEDPASFEMGGSPCSP